MARDGIGSDPVDVARQARELILQQLLLLEEIAEVDSLVEPGAGGDHRARMAEHMDDARLEVVVDVAQHQVRTDLLDEVAVGEEAGAGRVGPVAATATGQHIPQERVPSGVLALRAEIG